MPSSKTHNRQVGVQSPNNISILSKSSSKLLSKLLSTIDPTKSIPKPKPSRKSKNSSSKIAPIGGARKRTKTKKRRATKKRNNFNTQQ